MRTICFLLFLLTGAHVQANEHFIRTPDGIIVYPDRQAAGCGGPVHLSVITDKIMRITCGPQQGLSPHAKSLIVVYQRDSAVRWDVVSDDSVVMVKTSMLTAMISLRTGAVRFADASGAQLVAEKDPGGRSLVATIADGERCYQVRQTFSTSPQEAFYGLGQHQDGVVDYKGKQIALFQNNSEVAVPFLVSSRNYGILWDNCSLTTVGDVRPYRPLSDLKLFSMRHEQGWLTASYRNDTLQPEKVDLQTAESIIDYPYLGDSKKLLPAAFTPARGSVTWEGDIASMLPGKHLFRWTYGGYLKVFVDGRLRLDRWRQSWNPGSAVLELPFEVNRPTHIKIEWRPDGDESYISVKWQEPPAAGEENDFSFSSDAGSQLDYYFIYGRNADEVISGYRQLTGKANVLPRWAMGLWQSRERYKTQQEILGTMKEFRTRGIPLDNIVLDWSYWKQDDWGSQAFDATRFPSPDSMIQALHKDYHAHFMISVWPKFYEGIPAWKHFNEKGWLYRRNIADRQRDWIGQGYVSTFYDAFNADARKGFWNLLDEKLYRKGIDAWWMDASEPDILSNVSPGRRIAQMTPTALGPAAAWLNAYPLMNAKGIYEGQRAANPDTRVFILTRSAFAGSQRYAAAVWSGDIAARWTDMKDQIAAGINFSLSGIPYWTMDIGGFAVERRYTQAAGETLEEWRAQMTRWYQFGAFCPLFRVHGQFPFREIYNVAPADHPAYQSMLYYDKLRYRLLPYLYSLSGMVWRQDYTMMRGLVMDFGRDTAVHAINDQYMFGPSLLVSPVTTYKAHERDIYLPAGQGWYDLYSGSFLPGGKHIVADAPYGRIPVYVKEGSIVPLGPDLQYTGQRPADTITLLVYTGRDADFSLYEDEGHNYNYEKGSYSIIPLHYEEASGTLSIGRRQGSFSGMLQRRWFVVKKMGASPGKHGASPGKKGALLGKKVTSPVSEAKKNGSSPVDGGGKVSTVVAYDGVRREVRL